MRAQQFRVCRDDGLTQSYWDTAAEAEAESRRLSAEHPDMTFFVIYTGRA